ncbi:MAG: cell division protein ZapA [Brumimicrobium sp.]
MTKKSIKIVIAGRKYPLTINESEEDIVLQAVTDINDNIKRLQESYAVKDMQDLLAMTSLQLATKSKKNNTSNLKNKDTFDTEKVLDALNLLSNSIDE